MTERGRGNGAQCLFCVHVISWHTPALLLSDIQVIGDQFVITIILTKNNVPRVINILNIRDPAEAQ